MISPTDTTVVDTIPETGFSCYEGVDRHEETDLV